MSFTHFTTTTTTTTMNATVAASSRLRQCYKLSRKGLVQPCTFNNRKTSLFYTSCELQKRRNRKDREMINIDINSDQIKINIHRRNVLLGLGGLCSAAASTILDKVLIANGGYETNESKSLDKENKEVVIQNVFKFGSMARTLNEIIHVLVDRPKHENEEDKEEVLIVDGIEILNNEPVRFDVYIDKPVYGDEGLVFMEDPENYGEIAGSMVDIAHTRVGRNLPKGSLELGITYLIEDIEAEDSDKLVVTLVPRSGLVIIGGVRIEAWKEQ